ncbi:uncharacterized protein znf106b isoform X3 [Scophthalmus maximus]|uniref:uncharacterized protein znf106b isoform X3 n=1 Tax=Scophthalmus maximus TaxID=52904 RepID=UPI001FA8CB3B|nr:uncharacterized protein znf106b isoform X3 [Scophthalmus maximus]
MATVQTSHAKAAKNTGQTRGKKRPKSARKNTYCILCRRPYLKSDAHAHMHSMLHHRELESVMGMNTYHDCHACKTSTMGLFDYSKHISTKQHKAKLLSLMSKNIGPLSLYKTLSQEVINRIQERNKTLKQKQKKKKEKKKKKLNQTEGQKRAEMLQGVAQRNATAAEQLHTWRLRQMEAYRIVTNNVVRNKENKVISRQSSLHQRETTPQNQSGSSAGSSVEPAGRTWHPAVAQAQLPRPPHQVRYDDNFSVNNQNINVSVEQSQTRGCAKRPQNTKSGATADQPEQITRNANYHYDDYENRGYSGGLMFDPGQNVCTGSPQQGQEGTHCSSNPALANRSTGAAPMSDADLGAMLRQIRRTLRVREPCRADRKARGQTSEAGVRVADRSSTPHAGTERERPSPAGTSVSPQVNAPASAANSGVCPSNMTKQTTSKITQETTQCWKKRSAVSDGVSSSTMSYSRCTGKASSTQPTHKVRIAHEPGKSKGRKEAGHKPTVNHLLVSSGAKNKKSWSEIYNAMKRKKQDKLTGFPRFANKLSNPRTVQGSSTQPPDKDLPLSEGFHWESIPESPSGSHSTLPPAACDAQSCSRTQEPGPAPQGGSSPTVTPVPVKAETMEPENGRSRDDSSANKRKHKTNDGASEKEQSGKKKRTNKDQDQLDQLLVVSLREDELSHSLQDLDTFLVQARNALQSAYTEVQRLLLLKQQFTAEVNSLRTQRIDILLGMKDGASHVAEKSTTSPAGPTVTLQPIHTPPPSSGAFLTSSSQQQPATPSSSSSSKPHPTPLPQSAVSIKQEICGSPTAGQAGHFVSSTDAPHVPLNQPVPLLPSDPLKPSHSASAATPTPVNTPVSSELSAQQQERESREGSKGCVKTTEDVWSVDSDSEGETAGDLGEGDAADKSFPDRDCDAPAAAPKDDDGNRGNDSVKKMAPSNLVVIDISDTDNEDSPETVSSVPVHPEPVDFSSVSTQTFPKQEVDRKIKISFPVKDENTPAESVEDGEPSLGAFLSHTGPVHSLQVHQGLLYTCSADNTARAYSLTNMECIAVFDGHTNKVNCLLVSSPPNMPARIYTGSSDQTIRCYSIKSKKCLEQISLLDRVLCLHIAWNILYAGLANGSVASYDVKTQRQLDVFECHGPRGVSCLGTAQEGARRVLLVGSYDSTIGVRDAKSGLLLRSLRGHTKTVLCLKVVNDLVFSGSSDASVHAYNIHTGELLRIYKGHGQAVTSIIILGKVMVTACVDKLVRVYELQSHDQLQVYGGHSDMVMCMAVHKNVLRLHLAVFALFRCTTQIYTGCYDGSVKAVKLDLMKKHRCWWHNCSLIFAVAEHLVQHLVEDHSNLNLQTVKCRWRGCDTFFQTQQSVRQVMRLIARRRHTLFSRFEH